MDIQPSTKQSERGEEPSLSVKAELYFLIARFLSQGPCQSASEMLQLELETYKLLPKRIDSHGNEHDQSYAEVCQQFSHIGANHLLELYKRLDPLKDNERPNNAQGVGPLLDVVRPKENLVRKLSREDYVVRQNQRPRYFPHNISHSANTVPLLLSRELTGSINQRSAVPAQLYGRVQLFCRTLGHCQAVCYVLFDRTGKYIFTGAEDFLVKKWGAATGRLLATFRGASDEISALAVSFENTLLAAGSRDAIVRVWNLYTTEPIAVLPGHGSSIISINFCRYLVSTTYKGFIFFWDYVVAPGDKPKISPNPRFCKKMLPRYAHVLCSAFSPCGTFMALGCDDRHVRIYEMKQEGLDRILDLEVHSDRSDSIQWANTGLRFVSGSDDGTAIIWRYEEQEWQTVRLRMTCRLDGAAMAEEPSQDLEVVEVKWSCDDRWVITSVNDLSIKVWDSTTGLLSKELMGHEHEVNEFDPHPYDPNVLLSAGHDGRLLIWDIIKGEVMSNLVEEEPILGAKWDPFGSTIAATDLTGHLSIYGIGSNDSFKKIPKDMFFHTDYAPLIYDDHDCVLDEETNLSPHLMPPPFLVDEDGCPYPPALQRLVPGRENMRDEQLVPTLIFDDNDENVFSFSVEMPPPVGDDIINNPSRVMSP